MIVFKTFLKILNKCKFLVIMYTVILVSFGGFNIKTSDNSTNFVASKPDVLIINEDENSKISENLAKYIEDNCNIKDIEKTEEKINDALFYRDVNYIIYIPQNYGKDFLNGLNPEIKIKSTGDYNSYYAETLLSRYIKVSNIYREDIDNKDELIAKINETLAKETKTEITSKLDTNNLAKASFYYNFANYSIIACCVYVICLILSSFREENINKRTIISSINYKKYNAVLLLSNLLFAILLWLIYVVLSFILVGNVMYSLHGVTYIINSFVFTLCVVTIAFLIGNLSINKNAINGIVNVVAIGTSFLCGCFVPVEFLPDSVLKVAHILPSYYYINTNERLKTLEVFNLETLKPIIINMVIILLFTVLFVVITNIISKRKRKIG